MSEYNKQKWDKDVRDQAMKIEKYNVLNASSEQIFVKQCV